MICQQPSCWQIFYPQSYLSRLCSNRIHSHSYVAPVIIASAPEHTSVAAIAEIKMRCTVLLIVTHSEFAILLNTFRQLVVLATVLKLTLPRAEEERRRQHRRQRQNLRQRRRPQIATRTNNPTRIACAAKAHSGVINTGSALTAPGASTQTSPDPAI
jgi:6-pyruvoyl-tetrahydropterin synthase